MHLPQTIVPGGGFNEALLGNTIFTYGMGWFIEPYRGHTLIYHGGNVEGHSLIIGFVPQEHVGVVVLSNIAELPLPDVLLYEAIDRALDLPDRNWNNKFHQMFDPIIAGEAKGKQTTAQERIEDAPPTHPLEIFTGTYRADGYPDFAVRLDGQNLQACTIGGLDWTELRHYHYNVFEWHLAMFDVRMKLRFLVNDNGEIETVAIPIEPQVDDVIFTRKFARLKEDIVAALVGEYNTPIDGVAIYISAHNDKVYAHLTGEAPEEIKLYRFDAEFIGFRRKRNRLDFVLQDGTITHLIFKSPNTTLEAPKKQ
jgi:hypothetical protein